MHLYKTVFILMPVSVYMSMIYTSPANMLGESSRILYFHVPIAWVSVFAFLTAGAASFIYLFSNKKNMINHIAAYNSAYLGIIFTILTLISGSIWSKISWGSYWNWDPRQTSMLVLLMIYAAYFALNASLEEKDGKEKISCSYLIFGAVSMPFFVFIIPRIYPSLHPDPVINAEYKINLEADMKATLILSTASFTILYLYILNLMNRLKKIEVHMEELD